MKVLLVVAVAVLVIAALAVALRRELRRRRRLLEKVARLETRLAERDAADRVKSDFLATASHELRSPLTSIKGFVELLAHGTQASWTEARQREFVDIISRSTDRLVALVDELLDVARLDADHVALDRRPIEIGEAIREVAELMSARIDAKHQHLGIYVAPTLPLAMADANKVRQIVGNLLTNAHLYTPEGGRIHIGAEADRAWIRIVVADSGVGMADTEAAHIFERFYRAPGSSTGVPGTGLGLAIVKSLVDLHGGEIEVGSQLGRGTTFEVRLPAATSDQIDSLEVFRGRRILIVDDEPAVAELIADLLAPLEVECTRVHDGAAALRALRNDHFDAITVDVLMPDLDGLELVARVRADRELRPIPIVFVTVAADRPALAGEWTVRKPIDADELRGALVAAIRAGRPRVLAIGRPETQVVLEPELDDPGIEYQWETSGAAAARISGERRFEVALVDVGLRDPEAVVQALTLRGRRLRRSVIVFSDGQSTVPTGIAAAGIDTVPIEQAPAVVLATLRGERPSPMVSAHGAHDAT